jgi:hypothetical protein
MYFYALLVVLGAILFALGVYSWPFWLAELSPSGSITLSLIPQVVGMAVEIVAIIKLAEYFQDRKFRPMRLEARQLINFDKSSIFTNLYIFFGAGRQRTIKPAECKINDPIYSKLRDAAITSNLQDDLQFFAQAFDIGLVTSVIRYIAFRRAFASTLHDLSQEKIVSYLFLSESDLEAACSTDELSVLEIVLVYVWLLNIKREFLDSDEAWRVFSPADFNGFLNKLDERMKVVFAVFQKCSGKTEIPLHDATINEGSERRVGKGAKRRAHVVPQDQQPY